MATADDLDLVETHELVDALSRRHDMIAIIGVLDKTEERGDMLISLRGSRMALSRLLDMTASAIVEDAYCQIVQNVTGDG